MLTGKLSFLARSLKRKSVCDSFSLGQSSGQPSETAIFIDCIDLLDGALRNPAFETSLIYAIRSLLAVAMLTEKSMTPVRENFSDYVADLQLHMSLQARNLVPSLGQAEEGRDRLLRETQEVVEKMLSRQVG